MALRIMLLSLVATLGLEPPTGRDLACWTQSGRDWVAARMVDLSGVSEVADQAIIGDQPGPAVAAKPSMPEVVAQATEPNLDLAFEAASAAMTAQFATDAVASRPETSTIVAAPVADEVVVSTLEFVSVSLPSGEEVASFVVADEKTVAVATQVPSEAPSARDTRVAEAVRLTCEAAQAWAAALEDQPAEACQP